MSAATNNARSLAMPPPVNGLKRKTLADRAGETSRPAPATSISRPLSSFAGSVSSSTNPYEMPASSSVSSTSRPASAFSNRNASNGSHSSSVGPGSRPAPARSYRAQSAMGYTREQRPMSYQARPATSLEIHDEEPGGTRKRAKEKCMAPISSHLQDPPCKLAMVERGREDNCRLRGKVMQSNDAHDLSNSHGFSLSKRLDEVSLNWHETLEVKGLKHSPVQRNADHPTPLTCLEQPAPIADACFPEPSSHIPRLVPHVAPPLEPLVLIKSPRKTPKKPCDLPLFLNRETNTTIAWDTDSRLDELESQHARFKEEISRATSQSNSLHEMIQVYKLRSKLDVQ